MSQPTLRHKTETKGLISLGSNVLTQRYKPLERLRRALRDIDDVGLTIRDASQFYHTPFFPANQGADFVNAVVLVSGPFHAVDVLKRLHQIEADHGRTRERRWVDRTLDLDLIFWDDAVLPNLETFTKWQALPVERQKLVAPNELILPHPRLQDRAFVLVPMRDVVPDWIHPVSGESVDQMLNALPESDKSAIKPLGK